MDTQPILRGREKIPSGPRRHHTLSSGYYIEAMETTRNGRHFAVTGSAEQRRRRRTRGASTLFSPRSRAWARIGRGAGGRE